MKNKIFIIKLSDTNISPLFDLFNALEEKNYELLFLSNDRQLIRYCEENNKFIKKIKKFYAHVFIKLIYYKLKFKIKNIICFGVWEKIIFTPIAKILKIKIVWIELPKEKNGKSNFILSFLLKKISGMAKSVVFKKIDKNDLIKSGFASEKITFIAPGINLKQHTRQENIFHGLAKNKNSQSQKKFFTVGTAANLDCGQTIEILFGAIKKALDVIPNLQIIIIGEGEERKKLTWLAQKMEIGDLSWFVGEQACLNKWFGGFDIFTTTRVNANLSDIFVLLNAMGAGLPIISVENHGFDDIILDSQNGLLPPKDDSELLAGAIIKLQQNKMLSKNLGQNAKDTIRDRMNLDLMAGDFLGVLENNANF
ncbi:MAG: glycosyltransferase family 4 protein [Patescibacteria group bacterium]|nr:glycosyltransferase family 4 protein [Patescibacteria group bacterium]